MDLKSRETNVNPEEEFKKLREKTEKDELADLKRGMMGGYSRKKVDAYILRMKAQLQTAERTFKGHIAELVAEKEQLRLERDGLQARMALYETAVWKNGGEGSAEDSDGVTAQALRLELQQAKRAAEAARSDKGDLEDRLASMNQSADENLMELRDRIISLEDDLRMSQGQCDALQELNERLQTELDDTRLRTGCDSAELQTRLEDLATRLEEGEFAADSLRDKLEDAEKKLSTVLQEKQEFKLQLSQTRQENCTLYVKVEELTRIVDGLEAQIEVAKQNIENLYDAKDVLSSETEQLKAALSSLAVKAEALVMENADVLGRLEGERAQALHYRAQQYKLADMLSKVRTASRLFNDRMQDVDKALAAGLGQVDVEKSSPVEGFKGARNDMLDLTDGKSAALRDIASELNHLQTNLAQFKHAKKQDESDQPNIRYSMEKIEVDCPAGKPKKDRSLRDEQQLMITEDM